MTNLPAALDDPFLRCPKCAYDVRAVAAGLCPECGAAVDHAALRRAGLPWMHRAEIGSWRAFWATVWRVSTKPGRMVRETAGPVSHDDAVRFRRAAVLLGGGAVATGWIASVILWASVEPDWRFFGVTAMGVIALLPPMLLVLFLALATGAPSYWFAPRSLDGSRQERSLALGQYVAGPVAVLLPIAVVGGVGVAAMTIAEGLRSDGLFAGGMILFLIALGSIVAIPLAIWRASLAVAKHEAGRAWPARLLMGIALPVMWLLLAALTLLVVPGLLAWIAAMSLTLA